MRRLSVTQGSSVSQQGFSLLELLVAFAIMAMSLGLLYRAAGGSVRNVGDAERHEYAVALAQALLASYDVVPSGGASGNGESAGLRWQIRTEPFVSQVTDLKAPPLHQLTVQVNWGESPPFRQIELLTLVPQQIPLPGAVVR